MQTKRFWLGCVVCAAVCVSLVSAVSADIVTDLWDVNQGCEVTGTCTWGVYPGSDIRNMFGGEFGTIEVGNTVFNDAQIFGPGSTAWVSWKTSTAAELGRFILRVAADGNYPASYNRAIQGFSYTRVIVPTLMMTTGEIRFLLPACFRRL
jgi:hypothetical protein